MKKLVREYEFTPEQHTQVRMLAQKLQLSETIASLLYARGLTDEESMEAFLHPGKERFLSPFLMQGMKEAVDLLTQAKEEEWRVAVYGDYDADGIGACAILSRALRTFGIEPYLYVPERTQGYGMSIAALDEIFDEFLPDLIVTVDCGISNAAEVEYAKEQGAFVIVTDHHELPETLPDCIIVNPKLKDDYPYDNLCGAGVAFKLACALVGEKAYDWLDFAALSTVADSVPLMGENRDIVAEGLKRLEATPRLCFSALLGKTAEMSAQTLSFTVAPRINAAGRMGDAHAALTLFTSEEEEEILPLAEKLNAYNAERQRYCDELYAQVSARVREEGAFDPVIVVAGEDWSAGFIGIAAARIAEEFSRPALLFVRHGDMLRGSARSIEQVNIFEALKACSHLIEEFGGHAQAAGVNVRAENFEALKAALNAYISEKYGREAFVPSLTVCEGGEDPDRVARELLLLEPFGIGNRRPLFTLEAGRVDASPVKADSPHLAFSAGGLSFLYFGGIRDRELLRSDAKKTIVYEYNLSHFRGREYLKGFVRAVLCDPATGEGAQLGALERQYRALSLPMETNGTTETLNALMEERISQCPYGLAAVCFSRETLRHFPSLEGVPVDLFRLSSGNVGNTVILAPEEGCDLSSYRDVVYLEAPAGKPCYTGNANVFVNADLHAWGEIGADLDRERLLEIFAILRKTPLSGRTLAEAAEGAEAIGLHREELLFALVVFDELGLLSTSGGEVRVLRGKKSDLKYSMAYTAVCRLREE